MFMICPLTERINARSARAAIAVGGAVSYTRSLEGHGEANAVSQEIERICR